MMTTTPKETVILKALAIVRVTILVTTIPQENIQLVGVK
jgi:hypothetical protein